jgi:hypothetical protein
VLRYDKSVNSRVDSCVIAPKEVNLFNVSTTKTNAPSVSLLRRAPRRPRTLVLGVLIVLLIAGLTVIGLKLAHRKDSAPTQTAQPSPPSTTFAIPGCYSRVVPPIERPVKLNVVGCASVAVALQDLSWTSWGPQGADGTGVAVFKIREPNCAMGYQLKNPVVVHAWNPQPPRANSGCGDGLKIFADMILAFGKGVPPATAQKMNTQYNGMPAAHYTDYSVDKPDAQFIGYTFCS